MNNLNPTKTAFVFPGQGSQQVGMGKELAAAYPIAHQVFSESDEILGFELSKLCWDGPEEHLNQTNNTQPALFVHSIAALRIFQEKNPNFEPAFMAGHSLGELTALTAAGAMPFEPSLKLVQRRGELMKQAGEISPGGMAALLGLDIPTVENLCAQASTDNETVQVANDNCPGQVVVSGANEAVQRLLPLATEAGAKRAMPLAVSIAAHSQLMTHAQSDFNQAVGSTPFTLPAVPVIGNVSALPLTSIEEIQADLQAQLTSRVRWTESIAHMTQQGVETFVEIGTGDVLSKLIRRIERGAQRIPLGTPENFDAIN
ncbi:ACP S-malonyltransferase [Chloroflexota bacterium]